MWGWGLPSFRMPQALATGALPKRFRALRLEEPRAPERLNGASDDILLATGAGAGGSSAAGSLSPPQVGGGHIPGAARPGPLAGSHELRCGPPRVWPRPTRDAGPW